MTQTELDAVPSGSVTQWLTPPGASRQPPHRPSPLFLPPSFNHISCMSSRDRRAAPAVVGLLGLGTDDEALTSLPAPAVRGRDASNTGCGGTASRRLIELSRLRAPPAAADHSTASTVRSSAASTSSDADETRAGSGDESGTGTGLSGGTDGGCGCCSEPTAAAGAMSAGDPKAVWVDVELAACGVEARAGGGLATNEGYTNMLSDINEAAKSTLPLAPLKSSTALGARAEAAGQPAPRTAREE